MKNLFAILFIFTLVSQVSAQDINDYKYIVIPETYEFTGERDQYRLNSLTKFLFEKNGFNTVMKNGDKPEDLRKNGCMGLQTQVEESSGLFVTRLTLKLIDCNDQVVFQSKEGQSREKDFQMAYHEALRDAFSSIEEIDYTFTENDNKRDIPEVEITGLPVAADESVGENSKITEVERKPAELIKKKEENLVSKNTRALDRTEGIFLYSGKTYSLKETDQGLGLYQENSSDPIAILIETNGGQSYIYNSLTNRGVAYLDASGNLIVEYLDSKNNKVSLTYKAKN